MQQEPAVHYRSFLADSARWEGFPFRADDIVISTPPKCGTTWTQMICALLILQAPRLEQPLDRLSPWLDMLIRDRDAVVADLQAQRHRRFIKTHTPLDGLPFDQRVTYICVARDPRDVAISMGNHLANLDFAAFLEARKTAVGLDDSNELLPGGPAAVPDSEIERFWQWVDDPSGPTKGHASSLRKMLHHLTTFFRARSHPNVVLLHYSDLEVDLEGEMRRLAVRLGIDVPETLWPELVAAATFDQMRRAADQIAPGSVERIWKDHQRFFHRGQSGQWRAVLDEDDRRRYFALVAELADPEVSAWAHYSRAFQ